MNRLWLHIPVGLAVAGLALVEGWLAGALVALFLGYELNQDRYKRDQAFKDIVGACWGVATGGAVAGGLMIAGIL